MKRSQLYQVSGLVVVICGAMLAGCGAPATTAANVPARSTNTPAPRSGVAPRLETEENISQEPFTFAAQTERVVSTTFIKVLGEDTPIANTESTLIRSPYGLYMTFDTKELVPGDVVTIWWLIFNHPENCSESCGLDDFAVVDEEGVRQYADDGSPLNNVMGQNATGFGQLRATGTIVDVDGSAEFRAHLFLGDDIEIDIGSGLLDALGSEVHLVARTHGPAIPGSIHDQMNTPWGGCPDSWPKDPCEDIQVAIHRLSQE